MGDIYGSFQYLQADDLVPAEERALYSVCHHSGSETVTQRLYNYRTSTEIVHGAGGLDVQGFAYISHRTLLTPSELLEEDAVRTTYAAEVIDLICKVTGAKRAVVDGIAYRRRTANDTENANEVTLRGGVHDLEMRKLARDTVRVTGGSNKSSSIHPAHLVHGDFTARGVHDLARYCRSDIRAVAQSTIDAEDNGEHPRYAAYSVWRPLKTVQRDPLAVLDWRTTDPEEMIPYFSRVLSGVTENGEWMREGTLHAPPKHPERHRWYWVPEQTPEEVLIFKFADTLAGEKGERKPEIAAHCAHASPKLPMTGDLPPRESIECRVIVFWE